MQCPKCGFEMRDGDLFCRNCGTERRLVPDYTSMADLLKQKEAEKKELQKQREAAEIEAEHARKARRKRNIRILFFVLIALAAASAVTIFAVDRYINERNYNDYHYQLDQALDLYDVGAYEESLPFITRALELSPDSAEALRAAADIAMARGQAAEAESYLLKAVEAEPGSVLSYDKLITLYEENAETDKIKTLLDQCKSQKILDAFSSYICRPPVFTPVSGAYESKIKVTIAAQEQTIHYTTDGTEPDENDPIYTEAIETVEGQNDIRAIAVNEKGIKSDVRQASYEINLPTPNPPAVLPAEGSYPTGQTITVMVPPGCTAYYAFDAMPSETSAVYHAPILIPDGSHVFSVILVDKNGKKSAPESILYTIEDETSSDQERGDDSLHQDHAN